MDVCSHCGRQLKAHIRRNRGISRGPMTRRIRKGYVYSTQNCPWYRIIDPVRIKYFDALRSASEMREAFNGAH